MCGAELVAEFSQVEQGVRMLSQLQSRFKADGIDHKVRMNVLRIAMGSHQHLISRPSLSRKFQSQLMGLLMGDILLR